MYCKVIWEIFTDAIIPILVAIVSVYIAEHYARKRDYKQKKTEIQMDYLRKEIEYLSEIENTILEVSRKVVSCLQTRDPEVKIEKCNGLIGQLSEINEKAISYGYMLKCINQSMKLKVDVETIKKSVGNYLDHLYSILASERDPNQQAMDDLENEKQIVRQEIEVATKQVVERMVSILK